VRGLTGLAIAALLVAPNMIWNASHAFATFMHTEANANWRRAEFSPLHLLGFVAGQFGVVGPVLLAAWLASIWRVLRAPAKSSAEIVLVAMSVPTFVAIAIQAFVSGANANWAATAYLAAIPLAVSEMLRWRSRAAFLISFGLNAIVIALLGVCLVWPVAADRLGLGNVFKREEGWRELATTVAAAARAGRFDVVATENRSIMAELLYYTRPHGPNLRIWTAGPVPRNHFQMTMPLAPADSRVLLVLEPPDSPSVLATFDSARLIATVATPVDGQRQRLVRLYDARGYRGRLPHA